LKSKKASGRARERFERERRKPEKRENPSHRLEESSPGFIFRTWGLWAATDKVGKEGTGYAVPRVGRYCPSPLTPAIRLAAHFFFLVFFSCFQKGGHESES
jgi:hypothetical protein